MILVLRRLRRTGRLGLAVVVSLVLIGAVACTSGGHSADAGSAGGGSFTTSGLSPNSTNMAPGGPLADGPVTYAVYTPLTSVDSRTGKVVDAMAQSITSTDQQHWTIKIKSGWTFHNGEPVTAQSFADSWNTTAYGPNAQFYSGQFSIIDGYAALNPVKGKPTAKSLSGVKVTDAQTLDVTLTKPLSQFPHLLSGTPFAPMPKGASKDLSAYAKRPIGNGPYRVAAPGLTAGAQQLTLQRYDGYAGQKGKAATIVVKAFQDDTSAYAALQAGALDIAIVGAGNNLTSANSRYPQRFIRVAVPAVDYLGFPLWDERFQNPKLRQAFSLAIDRAAIVKSLLAGYGAPAADIAPSSLPGGGQSACQHCSYDPAQARQLLAEAGGWSGPLTLWTFQDPTMNAVLQAILNQLRTNLRISSISLKSQPVDQLYPNLAAHKVDGPFLLYMGATYPSLYAMTDQLFGPGSPYNTTGYHSTAVEHAMDQAGRASSPDQATRATQQAVSLALDDLPLIPLYYQQTGVVYSTHVNNIHPAPLGGAVLAEVSVR